MASLTDLRTRRAALGAILGGLAATVASALGRPQAVRAGSDGDVVLGSANSTTGDTSITNTYTGAFFGAAYEGHGLSASAVDSGKYGIYATHGTGTAVYGGSTYHIGVTGSTYSGKGVVGYAGTGGIAIYGQAYDGLGVNGIATTGTAVRGDSDSGIGLYGHSASGIAMIIDNLATDQASGIARSAGNSTALIGYSGSSSAPSPPAKTGLFGVATQDSSARGVYGKTTVGQGVRGQATTGIGVYATAGATGTALKTSGKVKLNRSGQASIGAGKTYVDVTVPGGLGGTPLPFATLLRYHSGVYVAAIRPNYPSTGVMRIYLNQAASATNSTPVSWFVLG